MNSHPPAAGALTLAMNTLKGARQFIRNGIDLGFIRMPDPDTPDTAHDMLPEIDAAIAALAATIPPESLGVAPSAPGSSLQPHAGASASIPTAELQDAIADALRFRWLCAHPDWHFIERLCWEFTAKSYSEFLTGLRRVIDARRSIELNPFEERTPLPAAPTTGEQA